MAKGETCPDCGRPYGDYTNWEPRPSSAHLCGSRIGDDLEGLLGQIDCCEVTIEKLRASAAALEKSEAPHLERLRALLPDAIPGDYLSQAAAGEIVRLRALVAAQAKALEAAKMLRATAILAQEREAIVFDAAMADLAKLEGKL